MVSIICALVAAAATIICAVMARQEAKSEQHRKESDERSEERAKERAREAKLQLAMIAANSELTVGVATALKNGHSNGEVEEGLKAVKEANLEYTRFLEEVAINKIK